MARFLFPCPSCNEPFPVATRHAGQSINCEHCQSPVEIPKLGDLRQFPDENPATASGKPAAQSEMPLRGQSNNRMRNLLFSGGLAVAVLAAVAGFALLNYSKGLHANVGEFADYYQQLSTDKISEREPAEMWDWWNDAIKIELGEWQEHPGVGSNIQSDILAKVAYGLFGLAAAGLLALLSSFAIGKTSQ